MAFELSNLPAQARVSVAIVMVTASTLAGIAKYEDYVEVARIPMKGDVPTNGFGSTKGVKVGDRTTPARALMRLHEEVQGVYADKLKRCITVPVHFYEFGALVMLAYNVGAETVCKKAKPDPITGKIEPNLIDLLNAGKYAEACARIDAYNKGPDGRGGKKVLAGLVKRRAEERAMCEGKLERAH